MRRLGCAHQMRRTSACLAVLGLAAFVLPAGSRMAQHRRALIHGDSQSKGGPDPRLPRHTGNILGAGAALAV